MHLLLFGCTGFVGRELLPLLLQAGHQLTVVSRRLARGYDTERADGRLTWMQFDPASSITWTDAGLLDALNQADAVCAPPEKPASAPSPAFKRPSSRAPGSRRSCRGKPVGFAFLNHCISYYWFFAQQ